MEALKALKFLNFPEPYECADMAYHSLFKAGISVLSEDDAEVSTLKDRDLPHSESTLIFFLAARPITRVNHNMTQPDEWQTC